MLSNAASGLAKENLRASKILAYVLPVIGINFLLGPLAILQGIYAKYFGLSLTTIAMVLLISRIFDAISDPIIGYLSDRYHSISGTRKPFVICGGVLFINASYFLYTPMPDVTAAYFLGWMVAFYLAYTLFEIPHLSWASDLAGDAIEKNKIYGWRAFNVFFGSLVFFAMPLLPIFETAEFTPQTLKWSVLVAACFMGPLLCFCVLRVPSRRIAKGIYQTTKVAKNKDSFGELLPSIFGNASLLWFTSAFFFAGTGAGMWITFLYFFVDSFLGMGSYLAYTYVISFGVGALTLRVWTWLANYWGKQCTWGIAMVTIAIGMIGTGTLSPASATPKMLIFFASLVYSGFAAWAVLAPSLLSDISDYGVLKFGHGRAGTYFSLYTLVSKTNFSIGGALSMGISGWYGFDATRGDQSAEAIYGMNLAMIWVPIPMVLLSIFLMRLVCINTRRHSIIRRRLDLRASTS